MKPVAAEQEKPVASQPCTAKVALTIADFVSAFQHPPFRWLFITNVMNTVYRCASPALSPLPLIFS